MIRADWATPPDGDFARYVDQLMARAAQARLQASATPVDGFDGASHAGALPPADPVMHRAGLAGAAPGRAHGGSPTTLADALARGLRRWMSPANDKGWAEWLQERVRIATATAITPPRSGRQHDPRVNPTQPRKP